MFAKLFGRKHKPESAFAYAQINAKIMPEARGELFEDPLDEALKAAGLGEVTGGGTLQQKTGEIEYCGLDVDMFHVERAPAFICEFLTNAGAPRGSELQFESGGTKQRLAFGRTEGLGLYLNGTDLPLEVYKASDVNVVVEEINNAISDPQGGKGIMLGHWQGPTETALYFYGESAEKMKAAMAEFLSTYPLCRKSRLVQIA